MGFVWAWHGRFTNLGVPALSGRNKTPHSTWGYLSLIVANSSGDVESSAPQKPRRLSRTLFDDDAMVLWLVFLCEISRWPKFFGIHLMILGRHIAALCCHSTFPHV